VGDDGNVTNVVALRRTCGQRRIRGIHRSRMLGSRPFTSFLAKSH
jgi:hypothetical protein